MALGEAIGNPKLLDMASKELGLITGQRPVTTKARKSIAGFKLREGMPIGVMVTLRGDIMWEFLDRLISIALPRIRDFKGINERSFDGNGNYSLGLKEQIIFPEIKYDEITMSHGFDISIVTTATDNESSKKIVISTWAAFQKVNEENMAKISMVNKAKKIQKFKVRAYNRCKLYGLSLPPGMLRQSSLRFLP